MPIIDPELLAKAMAKSGMNATQLATAVGHSKGYIADLLSGRRGLKRNPELRKQIAGALDVPVHWIERAERATNGASK